MLEGTYMADSHPTEYLLGLVIGHRSLRHVVRIFHGHAHATILLHAHQVELLLLLRTHVTQQGLLLLLVLILAHSLVLCRAQVSDCRITNIAARARTCTYLCVCHVGADLRIGGLALLRREHVPEQIEPFRQKWAVIHVVGKEGLREAIGTLRVDALLVIDVHRVAIENDVPVLVAAGIGAFDDLDAGVGVEESARTIQHVIAQEVFVDVSVEEVLLLLVVLMLWPGPRGSGDGAVIHHGIGARGARHHGHVGHGIDVVHGGVGSVCVRRQSSLPQPNTVAG